MKRLTNNTSVFFALLRAGLWEQDVRLSVYGKIDYAEVMRLAEEQSVVGILTAGLEHVHDIKVPQEELLQFVGQALQIEQQNTLMNVFVKKLIWKLRKRDVYCLLVKGQGIAQCYERPLWRASGDIDLFLSSSNYEEAKRILIPEAVNLDSEDKKNKHLGLTIDSWVVELHGSLHSNCLHKMDKVIDTVQDDVFYGGNVRSWLNGNTIVFLPAADNDVFFVFTHILKHFFNGGIGIRQVCDWCRLLWKFRDSINTKLIEERIKSAGIMTEWKAFAALAVEHLGMPVDAMPFYSSDKKWQIKAARTKDYIMYMGNFGHNRENSTLSKSSMLKRKVHSLGLYTSDGIQQFRIFPLDSVKVWLRIICGGVSTIFHKS